MTKKDFGRMLDYGVLDMFLRCIVHRKVTMVEIMENFSYEICNWLLTLMSAMSVSP